jgi:predicted glycosyltransferase
MRLLLYTALALLIGYLKLPALRNRLYYRLKPLIPPAVRMAIRRWFAVRKRERMKRVWPILPGSEKHPRNWPGWPDGKKFALVLTHDVEGPVGLEKCRQLMKVEMELGFRSSFNFVPDGSYLVSKDLRDELTQNGFEVGVHDLHHDGKLFRNRAEFAKKAGRINEYLRDWRAVGFRSGFMLRNRVWLHDLDVTYDASTFDTDPFEPQPDGVGTIFPFWVQRIQNSNLETQNSTTGYVELPYTLPQDSTLFLLFRENGPETWIKKLDWIACQGGMALVNVHPDYINFTEGENFPMQYPVSFYEKFLKYILSEHQGQFWNPLPLQVAAHVRHEKQSKDSLLVKTRSVQKCVPRKIWIDLDNTPHVPFFEPIIEELKNRGHEVFLTARDAFQVCELADQKGMTYLKIGRHHGKNRIRKITGLLYRSGQLLPVIARFKPDLALSHGSRSQTSLCNVLRIPSVVLADYEHAKHLPFMRPTWEMVPEIIPSKGLYCSEERIRKYPGIKEDVYISKLQPDKEILPQLGLKFGELVVTVRPPATEAHYHNPESEGLFDHFMELACRTPNVRVVLLPRDAKQGETIQKNSPHWFADARTVIPKIAVDGLNLLWHSDLVVSGGGTMNREAAALGVPVYSIFRGTMGAVDQHLQKEGRLIMIKTKADVEEKIILSHRERKPLPESSSNRSLMSIVDYIEEILDVHCSV